MCINYIKSSMPEFQQRYPKVINLGDLIHLLGQLLEYVGSPPNYPTNYG